MFFQLIENGDDLRTFFAVKDACQEYASDKIEARKRFARTVYQSAIADIPIKKLRRRHLIEWRTSLQNRKLAPATINCELVPLRAALHKVLPLGTPSTEAAWQEALKPIRNAERQRTLYLDQQQCIQLLSNATPEIEPLIRSLCYLPLRVGTIAKLLVIDFDPRTAELTIGKDKNGQSRKIVLPKTTADFFTVSANQRNQVIPYFVK